MGWKTIIIGAECKVSLSSNRMKISCDGEYQNYPICDIGTVIFTHIKVIITIPLLSELIKNNINVVICDEKNDPIGVFNAFNNHSLCFKKLKQQINWPCSKERSLWRLIVQNKIQTEIDLLNTFSLSEDVADKLKKHKNDVMYNDKTNREAVCAKIYFSELFGPEFSRDDSNVINASLDYGYKILASYISKCLVSRGYITQLGIHHIGEANAFNLTYDFIEVFRVIVDWWVYLNIEDSFNQIHKCKILDLLNAKIYVNRKWIRLKDAIEQIIDSYISYLNDESESILNLNIYKGVRFEKE